MTTITTSTLASSITGANLVQKPSARVQSSTVLGLPSVALKKGRVSCSMEDKSSMEKKYSSKCMSASLMAALCAATISSPAVALVDERMSTEGTGLPFGLSNNLLGWILFGVFGLIWALYMFIFPPSRRMRSLGCPFEPKLSN